MATRLYLPSLGDSPLDSLAVGAGWTHELGLTRGPLMPEKADTALATVTSYFPDNHTDYYAVRQFVSPPLSAAHDFTSGDTISYVISTFEENLAANARVTACVRVVSGDGLTERGTPSAVAVLYNSNEFTTAWRTRITPANTCAEVSAQAGDRIVVEFGLRPTTPNVDYSASLRFGDPSGDDFALTINLTTDLCPWVELSPDLSFTPEPVAGAGGFMSLMRGMW